MNSQDQDTGKPSPLVGEYVVNQGSPDDEAKAQKFILTESLSEDIKWLSEAEGVTKTEIVKEALYSYFSRSHHWNNRRYFLEKASGTEIDLSKATTTTEVNVRWCSEKTDPFDKSVFVACHILDIDGDNILINPIYYPQVPTVDNAALIKKSDPIMPGFIDFNPYDLYDSRLPYLNQLTYKVHAKYLWPVTTIYNRKSF